MRVSGGFRSPMPESDRQVGRTGVSKLVSSYVNIGEHPATSLTLPTCSPLKQFPASRTVRGCQRAASSRLNTMWVLTLPSDTIGTRSPMIKQCRSNDRFMDSAGLFPIGVPPPTFITNV